MRKVLGGHICPECGKNVGCFSTPCKECREKNIPKPFDNSLIHTFFNLTYASYLVIPRSILQSMDFAWQHQFVKLLEQLARTFDLELPKYKVQAVDNDENEIDDPFRDYERGRCQIPKKWEKQNGE